jgi:hypothetical protein
MTFRLKLSFTMTLAILATASAHAKTCEDLSGTYRMADHFESGRMFGSYGSRCGGSIYVTIPNGTQVAPAGVIDPIGMAIDEDDVNAAGGTYSEYVTITQQGCESLELKHWAQLGSGTVVDISDLTLSPETKHYKGTSTRVSWSGEGRSVQIHYRMHPAFTLYCSPAGGCAFFIPGERLDWTIAKSAQGIAYAYSAKDESTKVDTSCAFEGASK